MTQTSAKEFDLDKGCVLLCPLALVFVTPSLLFGYTFLLVQRLKVPPVISVSVLSGALFPTDFPEKNDI